MTTDPTDDRAALVAGLRGLADFLETHRDVPVPESYHAQQITFLPSGDTDDEQRAEVDAFAVALGVKASDRNGRSHYKAQRAFGPVVYESFAISSADMARYDAEASYRGCVDPDDQAVAA